MGRYIALWFTHLLTDRLILSRPDLETLPFILVAPEHNLSVVKAANTLAEAEGVAAGMPAADAKAIVPGLKVLNAKPGQAEKLLKGIGEWCLRFTPLIALDSPDGLLLEISGCTHFWGDEEIFLKEIVEHLKNKGYQVRGAMADTVGCAWAAARYGGRNQIIPAGGQAQALMSMPPAALRLEPQILDRLQKLGFDTIQRFIHIGRSALRRRFGEHLLLRIDQALGRADEPLQFIYPPEVYLERLPCLEPISTATGIEIAIQNLLENICLRLGKEGIGLRSAILKCYRIDGRVIQVAIGTNFATNNVPHIFKLFELKISTIEPGLGIELFTLEVTKTEEVSPEQEKLWLTGSTALEDRKLSGLLDKLSNKFGVDKISRYLPGEHYWPERSVKPAVTLLDEPATAWPENKNRPIILLPQAERIEVTSLLPDNPPMIFIYRGQRHDVREAEDAERIEPEWWLQEGPHRDYYAVEDQQGRRYWVFRSGHYQPGQSQWFLHGFFA